MTDAEEIGNVDDPNRLHQLLDVGLRGLLSDGVDGILEDLALAPRHSQM